MANISLPVKPFDVPESVVLDMPAGRKQDGPIGLPRIKLSDLPEETLNQLIEEFAANVMAAAGRAT
jgi:hypothetical protein